jgi:hypothetical protein
MEFINTEATLLYIAEENIATIFCIYLWHEVTLYLGEYCANLEMLNY